MRRFNFLSQKTFARKRKNSSDSPVQNKSSRKSLANSSLDSVEVYSSSSVDGPSVEIIANTSFEPSVEIFASTSFEPSVEIIASTSFEPSMEIIATTSFEPSVEYHLSNSDTDQSSVDVLSNSTFDESSVDVHSYSDTDESLIEIFRNCSVNDRSVEVFRNSSADESSVEMYASTSTDGQSVELLEYEENTSRNNPLIKKKKNNVVKKLRYLFQRKLKRVETSLGDDRSRANPSEFGVNDLSKNCLEKSKRNHDKKTSNKSFVSRANRILFKRKQLVDYAIRKVQITRGNSGLEGASLSSSSLNSLVGVESFFESSTSTPIEKTSSTMIFRRAGDWTDSPKPLAVTYEPNLSVQHEEFNNTSLLDPVDMKEFEGINFFADGWVPEEDTEFDWGEFLESDDDDHTYVDMSRNSESSAYMSVDPLPSTNSAFNSNDGPINEHVYEEIEEIEEIDIDDDVAMLMESLKVDLKGQNNSRPLI